MKSNWNKIMLMAGFCALTAAVAVVDEQMPSSTTNSSTGMETNNWRTMPTVSQRFVWMAATTDKKEIQLGELALQKATVPMSNHSHDELFRITKPPAKSYEPLPKKKT